MGVGSDYRSALALAGVGYHPIGIPAHAPFREPITFAGVNLTSATFNAQIRLLPDTSGAAIASFSFAASLVGADTLLVMTLAEAIVDTLPLADEPGQNTRLYWDMQITPSGGTKQTILAGECTRTAGVTNV